MRQRGFAPIIILVGILVIAVVAGGAYYFGTRNSVITQPQSQNPLVTSTPQTTVIPQTIPSPTTSSSNLDTANWKTYTNSKYGILINYPAAYSYKAEGSNISQQQLDKGQQISGTISPSFDTIDFTGGSQDFSLGIFHTNTPSQIADTSSGFDGSCGSQFVDKTLVNQAGQIGNIKYHKLEQSSNSKISLQYCFLSNTQNLIVLSAFNLDNNKINSVDQLLQKILSTFKFTN